MTLQARTRDLDPVFVDHTGRRRRLVAAAATAGALILTLAVLALLAGFTGAGPVPVPGFPAARTGHAKPTRPTAQRTDPTPAATPATLAAAPAGTSRPAIAPPSSGAPSVSSAPTISPTPTPKGNGRSPSHRPHPTKKN
jgi:hypothetical protein